MTAMAPQQKGSPHTATMSIVQPYKPRKALPMSPQSVAVIDDSAKQQKITPNRPNVTMFASAKRMLSRVLNRQGVSVACVVFLSGRTNKEGGSERGIHDRMSAEVNK